MSIRRLFSFIFLISCLSFLVSSLTFLSQPAYAQTSNLFFQKQSAIKNGTGLESWTDEAMGSNMISLFTGMVGEIPESIFTGDASKPSIAKNYIPGGAFGTMNNMIAVLNTPPASGIEYIAQVKDNFLGKPAYAQGVGFQGLQFLLPLWRGFRNTIYVIASIIFVIVGLMIMLRVKISPQAVVTVQSAIPQLITTLILVTFSYAIAGLVIDIFNFVQALVVALLFSVKGVPLTGSLFKGFNSSGFPIVSDLINWISSVFTNSNFKFSNLSNPDLRDLQMLTYRAVPGWISLVMLGGLLGSIVLGFLLGGLGAILGSGTNWIGDMAGRIVGGAAGGLIGGLLIPILLCIIVAIWLIKLYFGLLKCYVTLIFKIILAPLEIGMGAFPNAKMGFSTWILDVAANMAVFPVVGIFLVLLNMIMDAVTGSSSAVWAPSLLSAGGISPAIVSAAIGLAGLALVSKLPDMVPQYIFMIKPSPWGQAIGEGLSKNMATGFGGSLIKAGKEEMGEQAMAGLNDRIGVPIQDMVAGKWKGRGLSHRNKTNLPTGLDEEDDTPRNEN